MQKLTPAQALIITVAALILLIGGGYYLFHRGTPSVPDTAGQATSTPSDTASDSGSASIDLAHPKVGPIAFDASLGLTPEIRQELTAQLKEAQSAIAANPLNLHAWLGLGGVYKVGGDYADAAAAWEYILSVTPKDVSANYNLGDLYQNYLKDYPKAEAHYLTVIERKPNDVETYANLYTMYRYQYKTDTSAAADILAKGLAANPGNNRLLSLQQDLQAGN